MTPNSDVTMTKSDHVMTIGDLDKVTILGVATSENETRDALASVVQAAVGLALWVALVAAHLGAGRV